MNQREETLTQPAARARNVDATSPQIAGVTNKAQETAQEVRAATIKRVQSLHETLDETKMRAAERLRKLSGAVRKIGEHMRIEEQPYIADHAKNAGERLESVATYIEQAQPATLLDDAQDIARRRSGLVMCGTLVVGFLAGRFLKQPARVEVTEELDITPREFASAGLDPRNAQPSPPHAGPNEARRAGEFGGRMGGASS